MILQPPSKSYDDYYRQFHTVIINDIRNELLVKGSVTIKGLGTLKYSRKKMKRYCNFAPDGEKYQEGEKVCPGFTMDRQLLKRIKGL